MKSIYPSIIIFAITITQFLSCGTKQNKPNNYSPTTIPTINEVGATNLPDTIATVKAPFSTIEFTKPHFAADTITIEVNQGANITNATQNAIDRLSAKNGGVVVIPEGDWTAGRIELKSHINLHFNEGATLHFSGEVADFMPAVFTRIEGIEVMSLGACIYANNQQTIAITGKGRLIGPASGSIRKRILTSDVIDNVVEMSSPIEERLFDGSSQEWIFPPMFISPINCQNVYIEGISLENTAFWNIVPIYCDGVIIRGVTVNSVGIPRGDGIDVESSRNVLIEYCTLNCGDDCFTLKAGRGVDGLRVNRPTENVVIRYCLAKEGHGGITCGSETAGMIKNLYIHDCVFDNTGVGIRFKTRRPRGGGGKNLYYERLRMKLRYTAIKWDMLGGKSSVGDLANRLPAREVNELTPKYSDITIKDIIIESSTHFIKVNGIPESPVNNLTIENIESHCTNFFLAHDLTNATITNIDLFCKDSVIQLTDARNITFTNINFKHKMALEVNGESSDSISFENCGDALLNNWYKK